MIDWHRQRQSKQFTFSSFSAWWLMIQQTYKRRLTFSSSFNFAIKKHCRKQQRHNICATRKKYEEYSQNLIKLSPTVFPLNFPLIRENDKTSLLAHFVDAFFALLSRPLKQTYNILLSNILAYKIIVSPDDACASLGRKTKSHKTLCLNTANNNFWWCLSFYDYENLMDEKRFFLLRSVLFLWWNYGLLRWCFV